MMKKLLGYFGVPAVLIAGLIWGLVSLINQPHATAAAKQIPRLRIYAETERARLTSGCVNGMVVVITIHCCGGGVTSMQLRDPNGKFIRCDAEARL
jgi:hypothetical protein